MLFSQRETDLRPEEMRFILKLKRILLSRNRFEKKEELTLGISSSLHQ